MLYHFPPRYIIVIEFSVGQREKTFCNISGGPLFCVQNRNHECFAYTQDRNFRNRFVDLFSPFFSLSLALPFYFRPRCVPLIKLCALNNIAL